MDGNYEIAFLGGDVRQLTVADYFIHRGVKVTLWGIDTRKSKDKYKMADDISNAVESSDICILPLPVSNEGIRLNAPFLGEKAPRLCEVARMIPEKNVVFGGKMPPDFVKLLEQRNIKYFDYFEDECLCIKNALLTAEAAVEIALREYRGTVDSSKSMVIGYGRIGKLLTNLLIKMNSDVTVAARKDTDIAYAECIGAVGYKLDDKNPEKILEINNGYDIVFNTVPARLIDSDIIPEINKKTIIIDLASAPGCIDIRKARDNGLMVIRALSLPGKHSPTRAGNIIAESVYNVITGLRL